MAYKIVRTDKAEEDLKELAIFIALRNSIEIAYNVVDEMEHMIMQLEDMPYSGSPERFVYYKKLGYRYLIVKNYLIHYHVEEPTKTVYIDRIRHGAIAPENQI